MDTKGIPKPERPLSILVVEDHDGLRAVLNETLESAGHQVVGLDCAEALAEIQIDRGFDIAIIDLNLPGEDGLSLSMRLRQIAPRLGIVIMTVRSQLEDRCMGYRSGADLYLTKPIDARELMFALDSLARRVSPSIDDADRYQLDVAAARLITPMDQVIQLTPREARVLHAMALAPEQRLESWQILEVLDLVDDDRAKQNLEVFISRLRAKLRSHAIDAGALRAERGHGYTLKIPLAVR